MRTRSIRGGLRLSELGLGAAQFGNLGRETTDAEVEAAVEAAWDGGVRYFDTAPHYGLGLSERRLGSLLAGRRRDEYVLSTKVGRLLVPSPETAAQRDEGFDVPADLRRQWDFSRDGVMRSLEESLSRLGLDHIDIVYIHDPHDHWETASSAAADALVDLRDQGVIGAFGVGMNDTAMLAEFVRRCDVDVLMLAGRYTLIEHSAIDELLPLATERGVSIVAAAVYNSGLLGSPRARAGHTFEYVAAPTALIDRANEIARLCEAHGVTLPEAAIAFPLRHAAIASVVVGARTAEQVEGNVRRYLRDVPEALWRALEEAGYIPLDSR